MCEVEKQEVSTAQAILDLADAIREQGDVRMKIANANYGLKKERFQKEDEALRFDVVSVNPGAGFKVALVTFEDDQIFVAKSYPVMQWVVKNIHFETGDEVRCTPLLFLAELDEILELKHWLAHIYHPHDYKILPNGTNELTNAELDDMKISIVRKARHVPNMEPEKD